MVWLALLFTEQANTSAVKLLFHVWHKLIYLPNETLHAFPDQLSDGKRQRVAIARALITKILVHNEVISALDVSVQAVIINLLKDLQTTRKIKLLFVTHNLALVRNLANRILVLDKGEVCEIGQAKNNIECLRHPYTRKFLSDA